MDVPSVSAGKYVCLGLPKAVDGSRIRKNMFAVGASLNPKATWEFWADIKLNSAESSCVRVGYTPHCYIGHIRQTCKILKIIEIPDESDATWEADTARTLDSLAADSEARVLLRFCFRPELVFDEDRKKLIFKESKTKGVGSVVKTTDKMHEPLDNKLVTKDGKHRPTRRQRKDIRERKGPGTAAVVPVRTVPSTPSIKGSKMTL